MRKLGYEVKENGHVVWTLAKKNEVEKAGYHTETKLFDIPEERFTTEFPAYINFGGKLKLVKVKA